MSSVKPFGSGCIENAVSFAKNHLFSNRHSLASKVAVLALTAGAGYAIVQGIRQWCAPAAPQEKVKNLFYRITGKNIPTGYPVYLLGSDDRSFSQYSPKIVDSLMHCQALVSPLPISQKPKPSIRTFVIDNLTLTLNQLKQNDEAWFRHQFMLIGCSVEYLETQMELVKKARGAMDVTLESWQRDLLSKNFGLIKKHLKLYQLDPLKTHPLIVMSLLGNELDLLEQNGDGIVTQLMNQWRGFFIELEETAIMSANLTHTFIEWLADFNSDPSDFAQKIQMFCHHLDYGYSKDEKSEFDHAEQPGLYKDSLHQRLSKDPTHPGIITLHSTLTAKNLVWQAQILEALQHNPSIAIIVPKENLNGETGMLTFLKDQGYTVELV